MSLSPIQSMFDFLSAVLDDDGVDIVREKLQEGGGAFAGDRHHQLPDRRVDRRALPSRRPPLRHRGQEHWTAIDGQAAQEGGGFDPLSLPVDRFCNYVETWAWARVKDVDEFKRKLNAPPAGSASKVSAEEAERQMADFGALAS